MPKACMLTPQDETKLFEYLKTTRYPVRDRLIFALSIKAGLRVGEIAQLTWEMVVDSHEQVRECILIPNNITKGGYGEREIPINDFLKDAILEYKKIVFNPKYSFKKNLIMNQRWKPFSPNSLAITLRIHYHRVNLKNCSSHSGRRSFITNMARKISLCGGSLQDVRISAGHRWLSTTQAYIEGNKDAQMRAINMI